jgi:putative chitinase
MLVSAERIALLEPRVHADVAAAIAAELQRDLPAYGITDSLTCSHFMGQAAHETSGFQRFEENLNYIHATAIAAAWPRLAGRAADLIGKPQALANAAYGGRNGNGVEASGDGWLFRGRGMFQLTGRDNYAKAAHGLGMDLVATPDLAARPPGAVATALWFWNSRGCTGAAQADDCDAVTRLINGPGMAGADARRQLVEAAKKIFT